MDIVVVVAVAIGLLLEFDLIVSSSFTESLLGLIAFLAAPWICIWFALMPRETFSLSFPLCNLPLKGAGPDSVVDVWDWKS